MMASVRLPSSAGGRVTQVERVIEAQRLQLRDLHGENAYLQHQMNELRAEIAKLSRTGQKVSTVRSRADGSIRGRVVR